MDHSEGGKNTRIIQGKRDASFIAFLNNVFKKGGIKEKYTQILFSPRSLEMFNVALTFGDANPQENHQFYEFIGDITFNKTLVWWFSRKYPKLNNPLGVEIGARVKITYGSRHSLFTIGQKMGIWEFITMQESDRNNVKRITEDSVEALIGVIETILDEEFLIGVGYNIVYYILSGYLDEYITKLDFETLYDAKTRIVHWRNELLHRNPNMKMYYKNTRVNDRGESVGPKEDGKSISELYFDGLILPNGQILNDTLFGKASAFTTKDAEMIASEMAYKKLKNLGIPQTRKYPAFDEAKKYYPEAF
jgi:dsRNA-specific ribonuclease